MLLIITRYLKQRKKQRSKRKKKPINSQTKMKGYLKRFKDNKTQLKRKKKRNKQLTMQIK